MPTQKKRVTMPQEPLSRTWLDQNTRGNAAHATAQARTVTVLFASGRSHYKHLPNVDVWDRQRNASRYTGTNPIVAHPPCRVWSKKMGHQARPKDRAMEEALGIFAVLTVIKNGGVLEQPAESLLWRACDLPRPEARYDPFLWTLYIEQSWFGFATRKPTWLLISGVPKHELPPVPYNLGNSKVDFSCLTKFHRSMTTEILAKWLCQIARASWWLLK